MAELTTRRGKPHEVDVVEDFLREVVSRIATLEEAVRNAAVSRKEMRNEFKEISKQNHKQLEEIRIDLGKIRVDMASRSWMERLAWLVLGSVFAAIVGWTRGWSP